MLRKDKQLDQGLKANKRQSQYTIPSLSEAKSLL